MVLIFQLLFNKFVKQMLDSLDEAFQYSRKHYLEKVETCQNGVQSSLNRIKLLPNHPYDFSLGLYFRIPGHLFAYH